LRDDIHAEKGYDLFLSEQTLSQQSYFKAVWGSTRVSFLCTIGGQS